MLIGFCIGFVFGFLIAWFYPVENKITQIDIDRAVIESVKLAENEAKKETDKKIRIYKDSLANALKDRKELILILKNRKPPQPETITDEELQNWFENESENYLKLRHYENN